jgi:serine/threonine protein kinase
VKVVDRRRLNLRGEQAVYREVDMLGLIDYKTPGTIHLHEFFNEPNHFYIVTEYAPGGSLMARIVRQVNLSEEDTKRIIRSILETLKVHHHNGTVHRNLKPHNILLNGHSAMICDYGLATKFMYTDTGEKLMLTERCGTSAYVAPEILLKRPYDTQVDMWGVGIIAYMSLAGYPPFANEDKQALFSMISCASYTFNPQDWVNISRSAKRFISNLLHVDPAVRMTAEEALEHPWLDAQVPHITPEIETVATLIPPVTMIPEKKDKKLNRILSNLLGSRRKEVGVIATGNNRNISYNPDDKATRVDKCDEQSMTSYSTSVFSSDVTGRR